MKQAPLILLLVAGLSSSVFATQENISPNRFFGDSVFVELPTIRQMLQEILDVMGTDAELYLKEADVLNLEASVFHRKKYISYNPAYIKWITTVTGDKWATMTLLAHEVGHHLKGHTSRRKADRLALELEADEFAGSILYKLGATLEETQEVMNHIARKEDSNTHPARASRLLAIEKGWNKASNEDVAAATGVNF